MNFFEKLQFAKAFFGLVENPQTTENVFRIGRIGLRYPDNPTMKRMVKNAFSDPEFKRQFEAKYIPEFVNLSDLEKLPEGTLGREFYRHMRKNNLKVDFFPKEDINVPIKYIVTRLRYSHDLWHVLAGYDTSPLGELCLQAFYLAQAKSGIASVILGAGFLATNRSDEVDAETYLEAIYAAYKRGKNARSLLSLEYENLWNLPLGKIRDDLNIVVAN